MITKRFLVILGAYLIGWHTPFFNLTAFEHEISHNIPSPPTPSPLITLEECMICYEPIQQTQENHSAPSDWLPCLGHVTKFHEECLRIELERSNRCPVCRKRTLRPEFIRPELYIFLSNIRDAIKNNDYEGVDFILSEDPDCINLHYSDEYTPLISASINGHIRIVELLLTKNALPNIGNKNGTTPLMFAAHNGHTDICELLLEESDAHPNQINNQGDSALMFAALNGHTTVIKILIEHGALVNQANITGTSPLMLAAQHIRTQTVKLLLEHNADATHCNTNGDSALTLAALSDNTPLIQMLMHCHAPLNKPNLTTGSTPLMIACAQGNAQTVNALLVYKANPLQKNHAGLSALSIACQKKYTLIEALLKKYQ